MKDNEGKTAKKMGRKPLDPNGEVRTTRLGTYVTKSLYKDIQDLAILKRQTIGDFVNSVLRKEVEAKAERLKQFRDISELDD